MIWLLKVFFRWILKLSKVGDSLTPLGASSSAWSPSLKKSFSYIQSELYLLLPLLSFYLRPGRNTYRRPLQLLHLLILEERGEIKYSANELKAEPSCRLSQSLVSVSSANPLKPTAFAHLQLSHGSKPQTCPSSGAPLRSSGQHHRGEGACPLVCCW